MRIILFGLMLIFISAMAGAQKYTIDASDAKLVPVENLFRMGNPGPAGKEIRVTTQYITIGGKPVLLTMGEVHFSRMKPELWEDVLLKMKACGIDIIATYLFWNHHEEIEGQFEWDGSNNIRMFINLCKKHNVFVFPRIGPWCHGEARLGGTPDWILRKEFIIHRDIDPVYQKYVERYFTEMSKQFEGLYYKDNGPIIGIQLDNEYNRQKEGEPFIMWLKGLAQKLGMDVPLYTCTAWGGSLPTYEVLGVTGVYGEEPWDPHIERNTHLFKVSYPGDSRLRANNEQKQRYDPHNYPQQGDYQGNAIAAMPQIESEIGPGVQNTYHRRFAFDDIFPLVNPLCRTATGSNVIGYYVFAGTTQLRGQLHVTGEDLFSGYPNQCPTKSYDFQAAIRESGEISGGYKNMKRFHYFLNEYGCQLAEMTPVNDKSTNYVMGASLNPYGEMKDETNPQRYQVRSNNFGGFLFGVNYTRFTQKAVDKPMFSVKFKENTITLPKSEISVPDGSVFIWPLNFDMGGCSLRYATAQLINSIGNYYFFHQNSNINIEFEFDNRNISKVSCTKGKVDVNDTNTLVSKLSAGKNCVIEIALKSGELRNIVVLSNEEANNTWIFNRNGKKELYITEANMYADDNDVYIFSNNNKMSGFKFEPPTAGNLKESPFIPFSVFVPASILKINPEPVSILHEAQWLETSCFQKIDKDHTLYYRSFFKEFSLENNSKVKKATLYLYPESDGFIQVNEVKVNVKINPHKLNVIDMTGYIKKGDNIAVLNFPYTQGRKKMAARLQVEYENFDRVVMFTDNSWVTTDQYWFPSFLSRNFGRTVAPVIVPAPENSDSIGYSDFSEWKIDIPIHVFDGLNNVYMDTKYAGDRAELYNGYVLVADDFNNNTKWSIGMNRLEKSPVNKSLQMVLYPLSTESKIFFDNPPQADEYNVTKIKSFEIIPEYKAKLSL